MVPLIQYSCSGLHQTPNHRGELFENWQTRLFFSLSRSQVIKVRSFEKPDYERRERGCQLPFSAARLRIVGTLFVRDGLVVPPVRGSDRPRAPRFLLSEGPRAQRGWLRDTGAGLGLGESGGTFPGTWLYVGIGAVQEARERLRTRPKEKLCPENWSRPGKGSSLPVTVLYRPFLFMLSYVAYLRNFLLK